MRKEIITAIDRDGIEVRIHSLVFNIYKEKINLIDTIKGAVASYINSGYGFREYENNCYNFNWGDLLLIPNSFLRQFGIERESETESTEVDFNEQLFSANDLNFTEEKWETLKRKLFMHGRKALEDYLDTDTENLDKDSIENLLDQVSEQMPDEELFRYYSKYCLDADNSVEIKEELISTNMGDIRWLNAYASFSSYHADFTAVLFANMKSIKRNPVVRYVVKNIKWDTDGDQESFDSLPQEVILPAKFSKENYKDENGIFGKAEKIEMLDDISDWLSNGYGFCNNGFELTQKEV